MSTQHVFEGMYKQPDCKSNFIKLDLLLLRRDVSLQP